MAIRNTIKWMLLIVLVITAVGGGYGYWAWSNANQLLLQTVREQLAAKAPDWDIEVGSAKFDWNRRIHLYNLTLKGKQPGAPIVHIPEAILVVDRDKLADSQTVDVQRIRILRPELHLVRDSQGVWNWQKLPPLKKTDGEKPALPEIVVEEADVHVVLEQSDGAKPADIHLKDASLKLVPASQREFLFEGTTTVRDAGELSMDGRWSVDAKTWSVNGTMKNVEASGELLGLAVGTSPELRENVAKLEASLRKLTPPDERPKTPVNADALPNLGASATLDISFRLDKPHPEREPQFDIHASFRKGRFENPVLPFSLHEMQGEVHWANEQLEITKFSARNGDTIVSAAAVVRRLREATPCRININVVNLPFSSQLQNRLPESWQKLYKTVQPVGRVDVTGSLSYDGRSDWTHENCQMTVKNCSFAHEDFPYRFTDVSGTVTQAEGNRLIVTMNGLAGKRPARLTGWVRNPGPKAVSHFLLTSKGVLLDEAVLAACKPDVRETLKSLGIRGAADVVFTADDAGTPDPPVLKLHADLQDCVVDYDRFPYRLSKFTGKVDFDSVTDAWTFSKLQAVNGSGVFTGYGRLTNEKEISHLTLNVTGKGAQFDRSLYLALPKNLQKLWDDLSPTGQFDLSIAMNWQEGKPLELSIPTCTITKGTMTVKAFPYEFEDITTKLSYRNGVVDIASFTAKHDDTKVRAVGFARTEDDGDWRLRLVDVKIDDLQPDRVFRRALSKDLQKVVNELDPEGPISFSGMLEFRGTQRDEDPVTAAWDLKVVLAGNSLSVGTKVTDVHGSVKVRGTWDGRRVVMFADRKNQPGNQFDLKTITVHGYKFANVRGPFQLIDKQLYVGSPDVFRKRRSDEPAPKIDPNDRIMASAIGGEFTLDAAARFDKETVYRMLITMNQGRLEKFSREYLKGMKDLQGVMYGRLELGGIGNSPRNMVGRGKLLISPAALYELPVLVKVFNVLNFAQRDKTAFRLAYADFDVADRQFVFNRIDLQGDSLNMRGRGVARFDGRLALDFYSMMSRNQMPVPILRELVSTATSGWVGVQVRGTVDRPDARVRAIPQVDDALKGFLAAFGAQPWDAGRTVPSAPARYQSRQLRR